jgi:ribosomal protein L7/L12
MKITVEGTEAEVYSALRRLVVAPDHATISGRHVDPRNTIRIVVESGKIAAIKDWRNLAGCTLVQAKDAVDSMIQGAVESGKIRRIDTDPDGAVSRWEYVP